MRRLPLSAVAVVLVLTTVGACTESPTGAPAAGRSSGQPRAASAARQDPAAARAHARPVAPAAPVRATARTYSISHCGNTSRRVLLTFDDWSYRKPYRILDYARYLRSRHVAAEFFLINSYARRYPRIVRQLRAWGFWVGNHTFSHPDLTRLSSAQVRYQIRNGVRSTYLRPPYGASNTRVRRIAAGLGYRLCTWTADTRDWDGRSVSRIRAAVRRQARPGGVVLMHLFTKSYAALPGILADLHARGLALCRLPRQPAHSVPNPLPC